MFDVIEDVFIATNESGRGWSFELVVAGRDDGDDEVFDAVVEFGGGFRSREAARLAGEQLMQTYLAELDAVTLERINQEQPAKLNWTIRPVHSGCSTLFDAQWINPSLPCCTLLYI